MTRRVGNIIYGWDEDYPIEFMGNPSNGRYYGVELEIDRGDLESFRRRLNGLPQLDNKLFLVEDGSLEHGIEVVSNPMPLKMHVRGDLWNVVTSFARRSGYRSHDTSTCGLHVHVSRDALSEEVIDNILYINERFWQKWVNFSRRDPDSIGRWAEKLTNHSDETFTKDKLADAVKDERYRAINLTRNSTIEFRIFKGTLRTETIYATIELVDYIIDVAEKYHEEGLDIDNLTWNEFIDGISEPHLRNYMDIRGLLERELSQEERQLALKKEVADKIIDISSEIQGYGEYNEEYREADEALNRLLRGEPEMAMEMLESEEEPGDLIVIKNIFGNPHGAGHISNMSEVLRVERVDSEGTNASEAYVLSENVRHPIDNPYYYETNISSRLFPINPTKVDFPNELGGTFTANYLTIFGGCATLVEVKDYVVVKSYVIRNISDARRIITSPATRVVLRENPEFIHLVSEAVNASNKASNEDYIKEHPKSHLEEIYYGLKYTLQRIVNSIDVEEEYPAEEENHLLRDYIESSGRVEFDVSEFNSNSLIF